MPRTLVIRVDMTDDNDFGWLRDRCVPAVENEVEESLERLDGDAEVSWEEEMSDNA